MKDEVQKCHSTEGTACKLVLVCHKYLIQFLLQTTSLDRRARPRRVVFVEDFPRTSTGKIRKHELASLIDRPQAESGSPPG